MAAIETKFLLNDNVVFMQNSQVMSGRIHSITLTKPETRDSAEVILDDDLNHLKIKLFMDTLYATKTQLLEIL